MSDPLKLWHDLIIDARILRYRLVEQGVKPEVDIDGGSILFTWYDPGRADENHRRVDAWQVKLLLTIDGHRALSVLGTDGVLRDPFWVRPVVSS